MCSCFLFVPAASDPDAKDDKSNPFDELFERELATVRSRLRSLDVPAVMEVTDSLSRTLGGAGDNALYYHDTCAHMHAGGYESSNGR